MTDTPQPQPRHSRWWPYVIGALLFFLGVAVGSAMPNDNPDDTAAASTSRNNNYAPGDGSNPDDTETSDEADDEGPADHFGSGTHEVGVDVLPGQYKTSGPEEGIVTMCTYSKHSDDTGSNDARLTFDTTEGPASVTVEEGQFIEINGKCSWTLQ